MREPIAIIGVACRFPGDADTPTALWELMMQERDCISEIPATRWNINQYYDPNPDVEGKMYVREAGFIKNIDQFDADFFNITPREAHAMDPQQRLLLEVSWEALETAAQSSLQFKNNSMGIFIGVSRHEYGNIAYGLESTALDAYTGLGNFQSMAAGRLAHWLGTRGPTMTLDTACSSSLVAVHQACQSLRTQDCDLALAGGISLMLSPLGTIFGCKMKALSVDGRCRSFDKAANGYGRGEGVGVVVLKRFRDAVANRDNILAVISGSAINHDGRSSGLTVPNGQAQRELLANAMQNAGVSPQDVTYIEAHATGTALGDPIEVNAIMEVFAKYERSRPLFIGSIKPNIGHLESAAGIASLIKVILMMQHKIIPKQLHFNQLNSHVEQSQQIVIPECAVSWQEDRYFAGISSFGFSGTNAHLILTESPSVPMQDFSQTMIYLLPLSAKNLPALEELVKRYFNYFNDKTNENKISDICFTASIGRSHFSIRIVFIARDKKEMLENINAWLHNKSINRVFKTINGDEGQNIYETANAYARGETIDWLAFYENKPFQRVALPTYPFQKQRYWVEKNYSEIGNYAYNRIDHPLLGERIISPLAFLQFSSKINLELPHLIFLKDHQLNGKPIFPGAGFIEMILKIGTLRRLNHQIVLQDINIRKALFLETAKNKYLYTLLESQGLDFSVKIFSNDTQDEKNGEWIQHVSGKVMGADEIENLSNQNINFDLTTFREIPIKQMNELLFQSSNTTGLFYGPAFQNIRKIWSDFQGKAVGEIEIGENQFNDLSDYCFHPGILDSCLRICTFALPASEQRMTWVPVSIQYLKIYKTPGKKMRSYAALSSRENVGSRSLDINFIIRDENNEIILEIIGLRLQKINPEKIQNNSKNTLTTKNDEIIYRTEWVLSPLAKYVELLPIQKFYIVFGNHDEITRAVEYFLNELGYHYIIIYPDEKYAIEKNIIKINYKDSQAYLQLFEEYLLPNQKNLSGILHLWSFNRNIQPVNDTAALLHNISLSCETALYLTQALVKLSIDNDFPVIFITVLANQVSDNANNLINLEQAPLWGLIKVINLEHPHLKCVGVDLDLEKNAKDQAHRILNECQFYSKSGKNRIAYRASQRYVEKLIVFKPNESENEKVTKPFQLQYSTSGIITEMEFQDLSLKSPDRNEVLVEVVSIGLNFKDVLMALNVFGFNESNFSFINRQSLTQKMDYGFEFSGKVIKIGVEVKNLQIGDHVIGFAPRQKISNYALLNQKYLIKKPKNINFDQAATLPIAFMTATQALFDCGKLKAGNKVLIHAAAGGVGLAAVQLALRTGAEIFATAHPSKWSFLRTMGIKNIMNSRTLEYAEEIKQLTNGEGVDIVLNCLNGEYIKKNLDVIKKNGIFIEIGKREIWSDEQISACRPDVSYHVFDLTTKINDDPDFVNEKLTTIISDIENKTIKPLLFTKFSINAVKNAFKYMAQAKHVGKVIINMAVENKSLVNIQPEGAYLITGGLGGLGQLIAHFLIKKGAHHLILLGRHTTGDEKNKLVDSLKKAGAHTVKIHLLDVANFEELAVVFRQSFNHMTSIKGVVHAAGIINDAVLTKTNWDKFRDVFRAKVEGTWNLNQLSLQYPLDFFICFSSLTANLGAYGQANYAAANAFMDACMQQRGLQGLPGLTINWGPWSEKGMAANMSLLNQQRLARQGMDMLKPEGALSALDSIFGYLGEYSQFTVCSINWEKYCQALNNPYIRAYVERAITKKNGDNANVQSFLAQLALVTVEEKKDFLLEHLRNLLAKVTEIRDFKKINLDTVFADLGVDSLMAVEFANLIEMDVQFKVSANLFSEFPTMALLVDYLLRDINKSFNSSGLI